MESSSEQLHKWCKVFCIIFFAPSLLLAAPESFVYQGRILKPDETPLESASVTFTVDILSPNGCFLYSEEHSKNMAASKGYFSLDVGEGTPVAGPLSFVQAFDNTYTPTPPLTCDNVAITSYTPAATDKRLIRLTFDDGSGVSVTLAQDLRVHSVPFAQYADDAMKLEGLSAADFLQVDAGNGLTQNTLEDLVTGASTLYAKPSASGATAIAPIPGAPATPLAGDLWYDTASGTIKYYHSGSVETLSNSAASGTVTTITRGEGLVGDGTDITSSGTIAVDVGVTDGKIVQVAAGDKLPAIDASDLTDLNAAELSGTIGGSVAINTTGNIATTGSITSASGSSSVYVVRNLQLPGSDDANKITLRAPAPGDLVGDYTLTFPGTPGLDGEVLTTNGSGVLRWTDPNAGDLGGDLKADGTVAMTDDLNLGAQKIINLADPTAAQEAATKAYVDAQVGGATPDWSDIQNIPADIADGDDDTTYVDATTTVAGLMSSADKTKLDGVEAGATADMTAAEILTQILTVDGASSGLNADLLDGQEGSYYLDYANLANAPTIPDGHSLDASDGAPADALFVDAAGNVGVGTTSPTQKLHVVGTSGNTLKIVDGNQAAGRVLTSDANGVASWAAAPGGGLPAANGTEGTPGISFVSDNETGFYLQGSGVVGLSSTGTRYWNLGTKIESPYAGGASLVSSSPSATNPAYSFSGDTNTGMFQPAVDTIGLSTAGAERVRISSTGNVGIGTTSPTSRLDVAETYTSDQAWGYTMRVEPSYSPSTDPDPSTYYTGLFVNPTTGGTSNISTVTTTGTISLSTHDRAGTLLRATGVDAGAKNLSSGTVTEANGLYVSVENSGGGTIDQGVGVYIGSVAGTENHGLFQADAANDNYFAGRVGIGTTSPSEKLTVEGAIGLDQLAADPAGTAGYGALYTKADGKLYYRNGTGTITDLLAGGGGSVTNIATGTGLTGGPITGTGTISIAAGGVSATELATDAVTTAKIEDGAVTTAKLFSNPGMNQIVATDGTTGSSLAPLACTTAGDVLTWSVSTGWGCSTPTAGTVTSVGLSLPAVFDVTNSPVTGSGTLTATLASQTATTVFAAPSGAAGAPTFRALTAADIPSLDAAKINSGTIATARLGSGTADATTYLRGDGTWATPSAPSVTFPLTGTNGTAAAPTYSFSSDTDSGMYSSGANVLSFAVNGSEKINIGNNATNLYGQFKANPEGSSTYSSSSGSAQWPSNETLDIMSPYTTSGTHRLLRFLTGTPGNFQTSYIGNVRTATTGAPDMVFGTSTGSSSYAEALRIRGATGNVGIGTSAPRSTLDVAGTLTLKAATSNATTTIDFSSGNMQYTTSSCGTFNLHHLKDGGNYSFAVQGTSAATCAFNAFTGAGTGALTVHMPPDHGATTASTHTLYSLMVMGSHVYVAWVPGY